MNRLLNLNTVAKPVLSPLLDYPVEAAEQLKADLLQMSLTLAEVERKLKLIQGEAGL